MKWFNLKFFGVVSTLITLVAAISVSSASCLTIYQPKAPKCMTK